MDLADAWYHLVATYWQPRPQLAQAVLAAMQRYVSWIDIGLVANDRWVYFTSCDVGLAIPTPKRRLARPDRWNEDPGIPRGLLSMSLKPECVPRQRTARPLA